MRYSRIACGTYSMRINSITPDGKIPVSPCVYMHDYRVGDLLADDIFDIINSEQFNAFRIRKENYVSSQGYINKNKDNMNEEMLENLEKRQEHRKEQIENLEDNVE